MLDLPSKPLRSQLFSSFWLGGFECACHIPRSGQRLDLLAATQHDQQVIQDYERLQQLGITAARDGVRWHLIDRGGQYDFSSLEPMVVAAQRSGMQIIWDLCHFGWPDDLDLFSPAFVERFARFCGAVTQFIREHDDRVPFYSLINEISTLAWTAGDAGLVLPFCQARGDDVKRQLVRATIVGIEAIWKIDPRARIVHIDPIIHVIAPSQRPELQAAAAAYRALQFAAWDMIAGRMQPELGGHERYLDILGVSFYYNGQSELPSDAPTSEMWSLDLRLRWEDTPPDPRWLPFHLLAHEVYERYQRPMLIAETGHFGAQRAAWLQMIAQEAYLARQQGVPLEGICLYPIVDRPDFENRDVWHHAGLWDVVADAHGRLQRVLVSEYAEKLRYVQQFLR